MHFSVAAINSIVQSSLSMNVAMVTVSYHPLRQMEVACANVGLKLGKMTYIIHIIIQIVKVGHWPENIDIKSV